MYMYMEKHVIYNFSAAAIRAVAAIAYEAYMTKKGPAANDASSCILGHILLSEYNNSHHWW